MKIQWKIDEKVKNFYLPWAIEQPVGHILTNPVSWRWEMNTSLGSPQNNFRGDRWSQDWCSDTKIQKIAEMRLHRSPEM